jgi:hypothetical protein
LPIGTADRFGDLEQAERRRLRRLLFRESLHIANNRD